MSFLPFCRGAQKVCEELAINLSKQGHKVSIATSQFKSLKKFELSKNININRFNIKGNKVRGFEEKLNYIKSFY